ncbi:ZFYVE9 family protein [Megaselia abdita]
MKVMVPVSALKKNKCDSHNMYKKKVTFSDEINTEIAQDKYLQDLPPICSSVSGYEYQTFQVKNDENLIRRLKNESLRFYIKNNFFINAKIVRLTCCINESVLNLSSSGLHAIGQDEIIVLLKFDCETEHKIPLDIFSHFSEIYEKASSGHFISELGHSLASKSPFLGSIDHGGFLFIRQSFQCIQDIIIPEPPFLIGILIHKSELPWAKIFPLRLMLRLGAEFRYYPCPHISIRGRPTVYMDIAQTIINFLADFRNYTYTLSHVKGLFIHMEDRKTSICIPKNRYRDIMKAIYDSSDNILSLGGNFSSTADGHLVCIQNLQVDTDDLLNYSTQAINIQGQPRNVTGANFIVFNGALKSSTGFSAKCCIVEDGLMVQVSPEKLMELRRSLEKMLDFEIVCGSANSEELSKEIVSVKWTHNDSNFNIGVTSPIDGLKFDGISSIRIHPNHYQRLFYSNSSISIRCTEVFILQNGEISENSMLSSDKANVLSISEKIAASGISALKNFLDLLLAKDCLIIGLRASLNKDLVSYEAGSKVKFPPLYMKSLDNELIPILHSEANNLRNTLIIELIFRILEP